MKIKKLIIVSGCILTSSLGLVSAIQAAPIPSSQTVSAAISQTEQEKNKKEINKKLEKNKQAPIVGGEQPNQPQLTGTSQKVLIKHAVVKGVTLLQPSDVQKIVASYEGQELNLKGFQEIADKITDLYRRKGYATSYAFIGLQKIENDTLVISVQEGHVGEVQIQGNKWFKTSLLKRYIDLRKAEFFNYDVLKKNLEHLNEHPDVSGRVVLSPGQEPATTDVNVQVHERLPFHATFGYNDYNSSFLNRNKYSLELKDTNFLGFADILSLEAQEGDANLYQLYSARYLFPLTSRTSLGATYYHVDQTLGRSLKSSNVKGNGDVVDIFASYRLISKENFTLNINPGFEYKNIQNKVGGVVTSTDNTRIAKLGFDMDLTDSFKGRTILTEVLDVGIAGFLGGSTYRDPDFSRPGADANFVRSVTNIARVQSMPLSTVLMLKGSLQETNNNLTGSEQFQAGGYYTVRGYPVSEISGDRGYTLTAEYYVPIYFLPNNVMVPHTQTSWRDAFSILGFYDWGETSNNDPRPGEIKSKIIYGAGPGIRFNIPNQFYIAFDYGFALGAVPSTGDKSEIYIETKIFF